MINAGQLDRRVTLEKLVVSRHADTGAEQRAWSTVATLWARVRESSSSQKSEEARNGVASYARPTLVVIRWRAGITRETHRIVKSDGNILRITGVAELGRREGLELACEEWSHE